MRISTTQLLTTLAAGFISFQVGAQNIAQIQTTDSILNLYKEGTYEVPVQDADLQSAAVFNLSKVRLEQKDNHFSLKYMVPVELTGEKNALEFSGVIDQGAGTLTYKNTTMNCLTDDVTLSCKVAYQNLKIDQIKAEKLLSKKFQGADLAKRLMVQRDFSTDPVGIIKIRLK